MKNILASVTLCALVTSCGSANNSAVKAADFLAGTVTLQGDEARQFAAALTSAGVIRQAADNGAFFIRALSVSCDANQACSISTDDAALPAPSAAAATIAAALKNHGATVKIAATNVNCVTYVNPRASSSCTLTLAK